MTHAYKITGMTCGGCVAKVKSELLKLPEVESADVQLASPQATITMQKHISTLKLQEAISKAGNYIIEEEDAGMHHAEMNEAEPDNSYFPIFLIFAYIAGVTLLVQAAMGRFMLMEWMSHFMAGFFLVFSFFKLMNLRGFAEGYRSYDVVARAIPAYGFIYPFIELGLGIAFLTQWQPLGTNIVTLIVMGVSTIGVVQSLLRKSPFQCACLGTVIKLPLSKVTLFEDLLMVLMSIIMIVGLA
ncbi:MAG TPA: MauE/DoxX family redox-associated membrane protein [Flavipsychrobacter sp.]|nr:MauE/DoxX family redox-associated membrane protein [Flavipsychrobacter sp.]